MELFSKQSSAWCTYEELANCGLLGGLMDIAIFDMREVGVLVETCMAESAFPDYPLFETPAPAPCSVFITKDGVSFYFAKGDERWSGGLAYFIDSHVATATLAYSKGKTVREEILEELIECNKMLFDNMKSPKRLGDIVSSDDGDSNCGFYTLQASVCSEIIASDMFKTECKPAPRGERRRLERYGHSGPVEYRTVFLNRSHATRMAGVGAHSRKKFHFCRGHWRVGTKWIVGHWRGDPALGIIVKDYKLRAGI